MALPKTWKLNGNLLFLIVVEAFFVFIGVRTLGYSFVAALMPGIIIACILIVTTSLLVRELLRFRRTVGADAARSEQEAPTETEPAAGHARRRERARELEIVGWLVALVVMIYLLGFMAAIAVFLFLFLKIRFSSPWITTIAAIAGLEAGTYLVFVVWLRTMLYPGLLSNLFIPH